MACELLQREFTDSQGNQVVVVTRQLPASKALELYVELMGTVGTVAFPFIDNNYDFGNIIAFMRQADNKTIVDLMKRVVCMSIIEGQEVRPAFFDIRFNSELMLICKIFAFVLEANYIDFFKQGLEMNEQKRLEAEEISKAAEQKNSSPGKT